MDCPRCGNAMREETLGAHHDRAVAIDLCVPCQALWFDARESLSLAPAATLALFRIIGERVSRPEPRQVDLEKCPRCRGRLRLTHDMQRATRFEYLRCPNGHGRFITFYEFLREKDFIRPLTPAQIAELARTVQSINCSNCGAPVDLTHAASCAHCGTPLSMLDLGQAEALVGQLQHADARGHQPVDPTLPIRLAQARREVEALFAGQPRELSFDDMGGGLVDAGLRVLARWLAKN
jgi:Zn-finger nucleic acid-binding protein